MNWTPTNRPQPMTWSASAVTLLTAAFWGGTAVAVTFSIDDVPAIMAAGIRFFLASVFMFFWCQGQRVSLKLTKHGWKVATWMGVLLFLQIGTFHWGIRQTSASHATVLINTFVFWIAGIEHFILRSQRLDSSRLTGLACAAAGGLIILVAGTPDSQHTVKDPVTLTGDLFLLASSVILAVKVIYTKHAVMNAEPTAVMFWHDIIGAMLFFVCSPLVENVHLPSLIEAVQNPVTLTALLYQGVVVGGFCFGVQAVLLTRYTAAQVAIYSVATPLFGIFFAYLFRGDPLSPWLILSGISVATGIAIINRAG
ncbi:DMT family transporter [Thalassoroseus pseudoceratinae]|uniref:DMT family transporter n=1 Tax=Thalassoroseus pseudoceratinae TaxID=2713176 RepID=UPI00141EBB8E|nr:DMT family transporter [Thalassoroseus pseudoceratinae]